MRTKPELAEEPRQIESKKTSAMSNGGVPFQSLTITLRTFGASIISCEYGKARKFL